jgi:hypothetical protein
MTIIKPRAYKNHLRFFFLLFLLIVLGGLLYIFEYNAVVENRQNLKNLKKSIIELQVLNADLKNNLYQITAAASLEKMAGEYGLEFERRPEYLNINQWLSDSSR